MPMVHVMGVRMRVGQRLMPVPVRVRRLLQLSRLVLVLVVLVVLVLMGMLRGLMGMLVLVDIGAEQDGAARHPRQRQERGRVYGLVQEYPREHRGEPGSGRKERPRVHDTQLAQAANEKNDRESIRNRPKQCDTEDGPDVGPGSGLTEEKR